MIFAIISIFPEMFNALSCDGIVAKAQKEDKFKLKIFNPRDYTKDKYRKIDDKSFGGLAGAVMMIEPLEKALLDAKLYLDSSGAKSYKVVYLSPQGKCLSQSVVNDLAIDCDGVILVCGRYEGVDERFIKRNIDIEISIGDFVVSGGELPSMLLIDSIVRVLPGVIKANSVANDSFMNGLLDYPHYTYPRNYDGDMIPDVLLSGNHSLISDWCLQQSLGATYCKRKDLLQNKKLNNKESRLLKEFLANLEK